MRPASRIRLIATALAIGAIAAPTAQAGGFFRGISSHPASTPSGATPDQVTSSRNGVELRLRAVFAHRVRTHGANTTTTPVTAVRTGLHLICVPRSRSCSTVSNTLASTASRSLGFQYGDAAIGAGLMVGLGLLGMAGTLAVRRSAQLRHP
jgi:hypothetical protein